ncbi:hypothetical protein CDV31_007696 [Fusarium ambrosium]|uniref:Uncharacterized protein n=1 Tax=Fusarium ambrosium TaxID=131363 RepID=A0A428U500_9HYPO|nr:hypothetical protein CDV31_007696 [Fusarium ambrosium]
MPPDTLDTDSSCLVSKALTHCLVPGALQHDLSSAQQGSMPLAHTTPLWKRSAPGVSLASVHWNLTASAGQLPCPWRGAPNKPHLLLAGVFPSRFWGVALPLSLRNASTSLRLPSTLTLPRDATDKLQTSPQALSLTNLPLIFSLYVLRCDPCRASAPLADTPGSPPPGTRSTPLQPPARSLDPLRSIQSIPRSQSSLVSQRPAVCDPPCGSFLTSSSARSHLDLFTSPSSPPSKFKSLVDR